MTNQEKDTNLMQVDIDKCTGCGLCLEVCSINAINLVAGKAVINQDICIICGSCATKCPENAISEVGLAVPAQLATLYPVRQQKSNPVVKLRPTGERVPWATPVLSFLGREIVPRLIDTMFTALDRRLASSPETSVASNPQVAPRAQGRNCQARRRRRGKKYRL